MQVSQENPDCPISQELLWDSHCTGSSTILIIDSSQFQEGRNEPHRGNQMQLCFWENVNLSASVKSMVVIDGDGDTFESDGGSLCC